MICTAYQLLLGDKIEKNEMGWACCTFGGEERRVWWGDLRERSHLKHIDVDGKIIFQWIFSKYDGWAYTGFVWLWSGTSSGLL